MAERNRFINLSWPKLLLVILLVIVTAEVYEEIRFSFSETRVLDVYTKNPWTDKEIRTCELETLDTMQCMFPGDSGGTVAQMAFTVHFNRRPRNKNSVWTCSLASPHDLTCRAVPARGN